MTRTKKPAVKSAEPRVPLLSRVFQTWHGWPLYLRILIGVVAGLVFGLVLAGIAG